MKSSIKAITILIFFLGVIFNHQSQGQEKNDCLNFNDILTKLNLISRNTESIEEINAQLIKETQERKINFILSLEDEEVFKRAGANDLLVKSIIENLTKEKKQKLKQSLYSAFSTNENSNITAEMKKQLKASKEFLRYFGNSQEDKEVIEYLIRNIPLLEAKIDLFDPDTARNKNYLKFDRALKDKNWEDLLEVSAEILIIQSEIVDVPLTVASLGFDETANNKNHKYLDQTLVYAEKAIELLENDKKSVTENYGVFNYSFKTKEFPDGKANALGYMNYIIGYVKYFYLNRKDEAVLYFQKSLRYKSKSNELLRQLNLPLDTKE